MRLPIILLRTRQKYSSSWFCFHALPNLKMYGTKRTYPLQGQNIGTNAFWTLHWQETQAFIIHAGRRDSGFSQIAWELHAKTPEMSLLTSGKWVLKFDNTYQTCTSFSFSLGRWPNSFLSKTPEYAACKDSRRATPPSPSAILLSPCYSCEAFHLWSKAVSVLVILTFAFGRKRYFKKAYKKS